METHFLRFGMPSSPSLLPRQADSMSSPTFSVDSTFGILFIAVILTSVLWGVGCLQFYLYCEKFWKTEERWMKAFLSLLWVLDTAHQAMIAHGYYFTLVKSIEDRSLLFRIQKSTSTVMILTALIDAMVQALFVRRAWYLSSKNHALTGVLSVTILAQFILNLAYFGRVVKRTNFTQLDGDASVELALDAATAATDTLLAAVLIWLLRKARSGFERSNSIVNRLVMYTFGSSFMTAVCALASLISDAVAPHSLIFALFDLLIAKLYFNCLLASLNARSSLRASEEQVQVGMSIHLENLSSSFGELVHSAPHPKAIECKV